MNLSDRIKAVQEELARQKDALSDATTSLEAAPEEEALVIEVQELTNKVEAQTKTLNALKKAESALAARLPVADGTPAGPAYVPSRKETGQPGDRIIQLGVMKFLAYAERKSIEEIYEERYRGNEALKAVMDYTKKTAVNPAMTTTSGWAQELVQTDVRGFLDALEPVSVAAALANRSMQLTFGGFQSITVPKMNNLPATPTEPAWVEEGGAIPLTQFSFGSATLNRYKLAAITTMSMELVERATPQIESILRGALTKAYAKVLDNALLSAVAAKANIRPAGLLNGVTVGTGSAGTDIMGNVIKDLNTLIAALMSNNLGERPVLLINNQDRVALSMVTSPLGEMSFRDELASGRLVGVDVVSSANVPSRTAIIIDAAALATAFDIPMFDIDRVATVVEANADNTPPTMADDGAGGTGTPGEVQQGIGVVPSAATIAGAGAGYTARSLWQTYSEGLRMIAPTSWILMRTGAVAALNTLAWK